MGGAVVSRLVVLIGGTLYPAYASYKAVKSANVRQYVRWMMYWVVFALFITAETFTDLLLSWVPFYYEIKVGFIIWLLSPYTKGAAFLYRKFIHPALSKREPEIDRFINSARERSYATMVDVGSRGINVAANAVLTAAVKGQAVVSERLKSFSVNDLSRLSDDTPIHTMNPLSYNPPIQREVLGMTDARPRFDPSVPDIHSTMSGIQMMTDDSDIGINIAAMARNSALPPSGSLSPLRHHLPHHAMMPSSGDHHFNLGSQYKAMSMMNLNQSNEETHSIMTRRIEYTSSSAPPETTVDDSVLPDHAERSSGESSYSTLPRQRKKKVRKEVDPAQIRRSKRRTKSQHHDYSDEEKEQE